jgi:exodeoxyribonuclease V alpha subunit
MNPPETRLTGVLEKILYSNEENAFLVGYLRITSPEDRVVTVAGSLAGVQCGETLEVCGEWRMHPNFGEQFSVKSFLSKLPASAYGIRKYLGSGLIRGIGKTYANKIVDHFGDETLEVISSQSKRLREVPGIGAQRAKSIKQAWDEQRTYREVMIFLQTHSIGNAQCMRLVKKYGDETVQVLKSDPYVLAREVDGIGFLTADKIAHNLGIPSNSEKRIRAGLDHLFQVASEEGHTCLSPEDLVMSASSLLELDVEILRAAMDQAVRSRRLIQHPDELLQVPYLDQGEALIAASIRRLLGTSSALPPIREEAAVDWFEEKSGFALAAEQRQAILEALRSKVSVITGGPGTGKTTLLRGLVSILKAKKVRVLLASPTGRASKRLSEATGAYAQTIHRLLGFDPSTGGFIHNASKPLKADYVVVDESSMLDTQLASSLFQAIPSDAHLLLVGDTDQLPSVGCGHVLSDLIRSGSLPVTRLNYIYRQAKGSQISSTAHGILQNQVRTGRVLEDPTELSEEDELAFVRCEAEELPDKLVKLLVEVLPKQMPKHLLAELQVLCPLHRGSAGTQNLNQVIQQALNPKGEGPEWRSGFSVLRKGDRIIQTRNNYDKGVFNGDVGRVDAIDETAGVIRVLFDSGLVDYDRGDANEFQLAYAISIHKSQGSEYPVVVIPLLKQHFMMLERNLVYTAVTRGKQRVVLMGQVEAYAMAIRNQKTRERKTWLVPRLQAG